MRESRAARAPCFACGEGGLSTDLPPHTWVFLSIMMLAGIWFAITTLRAFLKVADYFEVIPVTDVADERIRDRKFKNRVTCKIKLLFLCEFPTSLFHAAFFLLSRFCGMHA